MPKSIESLFNLTLTLLALYGLTAAFLPIFGYQIYIFPIKLEVIPSVSFDYVRLLLLRSSVFLTMSLFIINYALYRRPYSALAPLSVFCYSLSIFEFLSRFTLVQITEYSSDPFVIVFWLIIGALTHYKNRQNAQTIFRD